MNGTVLILSLVCYLLNGHLLIPYTDHWFLKGYFNDFLAPIALLAFANILGRLFGHPKIADHPCFVVVSVGFASVWWEFVTPMYKNASVSDIGDCLAYAAGACMFLAIMTTLRSRTKQKAYMNRIRRRIEVSGT